LLRLVGGLLGGMIDAGLKVLGMVSDFFAGSLY
jgi:hypothetical protein